MNDLIQSLYAKNLDKLTYTTAYVEQPVPDIAKFINWKNILVEPPTNSSNTTINELKIISKSTLSRSKEDIQQLYIVDQDVDLYFIDLLSEYNIEYPNAYISEWYTIIRPILQNTKSYWNRPRPYQLAKYYNIPINMIVTDTHDTAAYPSGHTVYSKLVANILKDMYPQISGQKLDNIVNKTATSRVQQGVHYPSDNQASIIFSNYIFRVLNTKLRNY
jgi:hypothetical protein